MGPINLKEREWGGNVMLLCPTNAFETAVPTVVRKMTTDTSPDPLASTCLITAECFRPSSSRTEVVVSAPGIEWKC